MTNNSIDKPEIYLFISVDIINSILLKYNPKDGSEKDNWYSLFTSFYKELPSNFSSFIQNSFKTFGLEECPKLQIWKYAGKENYKYYFWYKKGKFIVILKCVEKRTKKFFIATAFYVFDSNIEYYEELYAKGEKIDSWT